MVLRTDTLSYKYLYRALKSELYRTLISEQLKYFQRTDKSIQVLTPGTTIVANLQTKMHQLVTQNTMKVNIMKADDTFQLETQQPSGKIIQTYKFDTERSGAKILVYSEQNVFESNRNQMNFMIFGLMYKYFYNRGVRKRMRYLDDLAQSVE
ncbi:DUF3284 domain-containing protein [uncultured Lactiplantibacillus sp.]|uniref:DUF3284 domain-containing protein n=1 Tax=uncultured Lactiplantibacillus sp. TaxID=2767844 RepID=UPI00259B8E0C|nr:DUF3284 domain-containing protein [uncultured Lactiplantibacillus sp.]